VEWHLKTITKWIVGLLFIFILILVYKTYNPLDSVFFPKCPFKVATGYDCAGCGSQRAVHHLLNLNIGKAFRENILLVVSIPYIITGFLFNIYKDKQNPIFLKWRRRLFGLHATYIVLFIVISFWILRNIL
jgi:hypothetical protein